MGHISAEHNHVHEHAHTDGTVHTHDHVHEGEHVHEHSAKNEAEQTKALLAYMIHHNEHHAEELADMIEALPEESAKKLRKAIGTFEAANVELQEVLDSLN